MYQILYSFSVFWWKYFVESVMKSMKSEIKVIEKLLNVS